MQRTIAHLTQEQTRLKNEGDGARAQAAQLNNKLSITTRAEYLARTTLVAAQREVETLKALRAQDQQQFEHRHARLMSALKESGTINLQQTPGGSASELFLAFLRWLADPWQSVMSTWRLQLTC